MTFIKVDDVFDDDGITHAQRIMGIGIIIVPPHEFEHQSHW
jgi:hypothetical protein